MSKVIVKKTDDSDALAEVLADSIVAISVALKKIRSGRLNDKAILLLISHNSGVTQREVKLVLDGMQSLEATYIRKPVKP